jgi:uncharacterized protein
VGSNERIHSIDVMRGVAILGIFLTNMLAFHSPMLYLNPYIWWSSKVDQNIYNFIDFFVQASFYPLFALLFGFGLMIIKKRSMDKGISFIPIAIRRLSLLLVIGCLHAFFIWHGDILITYALFGLITLLFLHLSGKTLIISGMISYLVPNFLLLLLMILVALTSSVPEYSNHDEALQSVEVYQEGTFWEVTLQRVHDWNMVNGLEALPILFFTIFPFLLIGAGIAKLGWISNTVKYKKQLKIMFVFFIVLGSLLKLLPFAVRNLISEYVQDIFGGPLFAVAYAIIIILLMDKFNGRLHVFQAVGKLAISNYLFQSIVATLIFYSYGLGLYNKISVAQGTLLAVIIFIIQVIISNKWVQHYRYGPVEWVWRAFTYWQKPKWKK